MPRDYNPPPVALSQTGGEGMIPVYQTNRGGEQILQGYQPDPNYVPPMIDAPKPASILALEKQLGGTFEPVYAQKTVQERGHNGGQVAVNYGAPIGYRIDPGNSTYVNFDAQGNYAGTQKRGGALSGFEPLIGAALSFALPGIGSLIGDLLVENELLPLALEQYATDIGMGIASTAAQVAQGVPLDKAVTNSMVNGIVNVGSVEYAKDLAKVIGNNKVSDMVMSAAASAVKTAAVGGTEQDIVNNMTAGLAGSASSIALQDAFELSKTTGRIIGQAVAGQMLNGEIGALQGALSELGAQANSKTGIFKTTSTDTGTDALSQDKSVLDAIAATTYTDPDLANQLSSKEQATLNEQLSSAGLEPVKVSGAGTTGTDVVTTGAVTPKTGAATALNPVSLIGTALDPMRDVVTTDTSLATKGATTLDPKTVSATDLGQVTTSGKTDVITPAATVLDPKTVSTTDLGQVTTSGSRDVITPDATVLDPKTVSAKDLGRVEVSGTRDIVSPDATVLDPKTISATKLAGVDVTGKRDVISPDATVLDPKTVSATDLGRVEVSGKRDVISPDSVLASTDTTTDKTTTSDYKPDLIIKSGVAPTKKTTPKSTDVLASALSIAPYRGAGEIEDPSTGKKRRNVWNEESLRLKDALGI